MKSLAFVSLILCLLIPLPTLAHPGRTDAYGCHTCRTNCPSWGLSTGEYHCHNAKALPQPKTPIKSTYGAGGTGYTQPAQTSPATIPVPTPFVTPSIPKASLDDQIKAAIEKERAAYYNNPHWFRERLIQKLMSDLKSTEVLTARYVYTMLLDVK